jgi:hypothetical protein
MAIAKVEIWVSDKPRFGGDRFDRPAQITSHLLHLLGTLDSDLSADFITCKMVNEDTNTAFKP